MLAQPLHRCGVDELPCSFKLASVELVQVAYLPASSLRLLRWEARTSSHHARYALCTCALDTRMWHPSTQPYRATHLPIHQQASRFPLHVFACLLGAMLKRYGRQNARHRLRHLCFYQLRLADQTSERMAPSLSSVEPKPAGLSCCAWHDFYPVEFLALLADSGMPPVWQ